MTINTTITAKAFALLLSCFMGLSVTAQTTPKGWETYSIPRTCSFAIPSTMEVRLPDSFFGRFVKSVHQSSFYEMICNECDLFFEEAQIVLQPKGLNGDPFSNEFKDANNSYGRIIIKFSYNDVLSQEDIKDATPSELRILDTMWRNEIKEGLECLGKYNSGFTSSFKWYPLRKEKYSNLFALVTEYDRPGTGAETHVREYKFFYKGKYMVITTSYNVKYEAKYKDDFKTFMQLLKIEANVKPPQSQTVSTNNGVYSSDEFHFRYTYDKTRYSIKPKQNKASHCFCKLESIEGFNVILFSAWDAGDESLELSLYDEDVVADMKQRDRDYCSVGRQLVKSCEKVKIGKAEALLTMLYYDLMGVRYVHTTYRAYHKGRLYTLDFHIPKTEYDKNNNIVKELVKGVEFI